MKKLLIGLLMLGSLSTFANIEFSANEIVDRGNYSEVIKPHVLGCASGECYGGEHRWYLKPSYSKSKVCRKLGFKKYIRGSRSVGKISNIYRYSKFKHSVMYRSGYPGAPAWEGRSVNFIKRIECEK